MRCFDPGFEPVALPMLWPNPDQHDPGCLNKQGAQILPRFDMRPRIVRSRVEICFGTSPSQAAKSRPLANTSPLPIAATMALEMIGPMLGTLINRSHAGSLQASAPISLDRASMRSSSRCQSCASPSMMCSMRSDKTSVRLARMPGNYCLDCLQSFDCLQGFAGIAAKDQPRTKIPKAFQMAEPLSFANAPQGGCADGRPRGSRWRAQFHWGFFVHPLNSNVRDRGLLCRGVTPKRHPLSSLPRASFKKCA